MSISDKIRQIQGRPPEQKVKILWTTVAIAAVVLILIWIISMPARNQADDRQSRTGEKFREIYSNFREEFKNFNRP